jgi:hypothetical protein
VRRDLLALEALGDHAETVRGVIDVGVVDLLRVAREHDLGALTAARDDGLHLVGRQVLRLVDDQELVRQAAATDVREGLDLDGAALEQLEKAAPTRRLGAALREQELEVVEDRLHPGVELLVDVSRQEADVAAERHDRS